MEASRFCCACAAEARFPPAAEFVEPLVPKMAMADSALELVLMASDIVQRNPAEIYDNRVCRYSCSLSRLLYRIGD